MKNATSKASAPWGPNLQFNNITPLARKGFGGLVRDHFGNGRLNVTVAHHGGLINIAYAGQQNLGAFRFFHGAVETAWNKLFRLYATVDGRRYYPELNDTRLFPFGFTSQCKLGNVAIEHDLLLLPDALVQRLHVAHNPGQLKIAIGMLHQEAITSVGRGNRTWSDFIFNPKLNAFVVSCTDLNPTVHGKPEAESLSQTGLGTIIDAPKAVTWIGLGCDLKLTTHRGYHHRSKHYILSDALKNKEGAFYVVFAASRSQLERRLRQLSKTVHRECEELIDGYEARLKSRPRIDVRQPVLNSAFGQFPEMINSMKIPDRPGATKATLAGYWVWGWDGMMPLVPMALANEPEYTAAILRFFQQTRDKRLGLPMQFTTAFKPALQAPLPAQFQFVAGLYHYVATTGDLNLARELFPTCNYLLNRCRQKCVKNTGLISDWALWPDFPEAMGENGHDVSSMNNSIAYQGLRSMEYLAAALGKAKLARECRDWARRLRFSFVKYFYDAKKGYFFSSCSSIDLKPRKHYPAQAIFWITPFARELVAHDSRRIAAFMDKHLRSSKCLLTLPLWDTAWMADGNQLGSSFPAADAFYLNIHKLIGNDDGLKRWLGDVEWFWRHHTAPEAFTPEAENEGALGPDNTGCKQSQAVSTWYAGFYNGVAGLDFDHEGITVTPWGSMPVDVRGLRLRGVSIDLKIRGRGTHLGSLRLNGKLLPAGLHKIAWNSFKGKSARIEVVRSERAPSVPVIIRADGLHGKLLESGHGRLVARIEGDMTGEVIVRAPARARIFINDERLETPRDSVLGTFTIPFNHNDKLKLEVIVPPRRGT